VLCKELYGSFLTPICSTQSPPKGVLCFILIFFGGGCYAYEGLRLCRLSKDSSLYSEGEETVTCVYIDRVIKCAGLMLLTIMLFIATASGIAEAGVCQGSISYNQIKMFAVVPPGSLQVCYFPAGHGSVTLGADIASWAYWDDERPPDVTINIFWGTSSSATQWTYISTIYAEPWWQYSSPLWLSQGVYVFSINTSAQAGVNLYVRPY